MRPRTLVHPWIARELPDLAGERWDAALASIGFEPRASAIARHLPAVDGPRVAVEFKVRREHAYPDNLAFFNDGGWTVTQDWDDLEFLRMVKALLEDLAGRGGEHVPRVAVDVSSMTRARIAAVVQALWELRDDAAVIADFLYAPAVFTEPVAPPPAILRLEPVSAYLSGSLDALPDVLLIVGLGYEPYKAAGTVEFLEPREVMVFVPEGPDEKYLNRVHRANAGLLDGPLDPERIHYAVSDPFDAFSSLESVVYDRLQQPGWLPALVPLGPKIFAVCVCVAAALHVEDVPVWRVSFRTDEPAHPHEAAGPVYGLTVEMKPVGLDGPPGAEPPR